MKRIFRYITIVALALCPLCAVAALDLPVKTVKGRQFYYYEVKKGDTLYGIASRLSISRKDIVESNPEAGDLIRVGQILYFPVDRFGDGTPVADTVVPQENTAPARTDVVVHQVKKGDTLYGLSRKYNVDVESIIALNPGSRTGIKAGATLRIPVMAADDDVSGHDEVITAEEPEFPVNVISTQPVHPDIVPVYDNEDEGTGEEVGDDSESEKDTDALSEDDDDTTDGDTDPTLADINAGSSSIVVMLPFMLDDEVPSRQAMLYTDFYKGLLVAADSLSQRSDSIRIYAYDTMGENARVSSLLQDPAVAGASVIIAPSDDDQLSMILRSVDPQKTKVLNVFNVRDSSYVNSPASIQANIPHRRMYARAMRAIDKYYPEYTPVILKNENGRSDKAEFISYITDIYRMRDVEPIEIVYDGALLMSQLEAIPNNGSRYLFIPASGSLAEFNKISHAISSIRNASVAQETYALFGYPDWTAFRNDAEQMLHTLGATVYSRFYYDEDCFDSRCLNDAFERWFGTRAIGVVPNHGMLGFDVGNMLIRNIRDNNGYFVPAADHYKGVQTSFRFVQDNENGGYMNDEIYVLRFTPQGSVERLPM